MNKRDSHGFFSRRIVGRSSDRSYYSTDSSPNILNQWRLQGVSEVSGNWSAFQAGQLTILSKAAGMVTVTGMRMNKTNLVRA